MAPLSYAWLWIVDRFHGIRVALERELVGQDADVWSSTHVDVMAIKKFLIEVNGLEILLTKPQDPVLFSFKTFLERSHCAESLDFILAVNEYKQCFSDAVTMSWGADMESDIRGRFDTIYHQFIKTNAYRQVNISSEARHRVETQKRQCDEDNSLPGKDVFDVSSREIVKMLKSERWPKFVRTMHAGSDGSHAGSRPSYGADGLDWNLWQK